LGGKKVSQRRGNNWSTRERCSRRRKHRTFIREAMISTGERGYSKGPTWRRKKGKKKGGSGLWLTSVVGLGWKENPQSSGGKLVRERRGFQGTKKKTSAESTILKSWEGVGGGLH